LVAAAFHELSASVGSGVTVGFAINAWYGLILAPAAAYLFWRGFLGQVVSDAHAVKRKIRPEPAPPEEIPPDPYVVIGHPGGHISLTTPAGDQHRQLAVAQPHYLIENKDPLRSVTQVSTGSRTRDGAHEYVFAEFHAPLLGAGETAPFVAQESLPVDWFEGVHESVAQLAFLYWIRFREVVYDPEERSCHARLI